MLRPWRPLALIPFLLALSAQPSLAHTHSAASRHTYPHHRYHRNLVWRDGDAAREHSASAGDNDSWSQESSWPHENSWRQQGSWQQQHIASASSFGGYAEAYPARYGRRSRQYEQGWNSRSDEGGYGGGGSQLQGMAEQQASANGVPVSLVDRVITRESGGNPRAVSRGNYGLMQIRLGTARAMGYSGSAAGLLDPSTNMTYAVRYLAGAYRAAGGNENRAVALYARGYRATPRVQEASYYGEQPEAAGFSGSASSDSYAPRMARRMRHYRHREL